MIKISVIIPVYNREKYIAECLNSVLSQTLKELEIICVDDGSTDGTYDILMDYSSRYANIVVLHQENQGSGPARNKGIEYAHGEYICFMDSDDYYAEDCVLEHLYKEAEENHVLVCGGIVLSARENGETRKLSKYYTGKKKISFSKYGNFMNYTGFIYSLKLVCENNIMFPPYKRFQDPPFFLNVMSHAQELFVIDEVIYVYRQWERELKWTFDIAIDVLKGLRECFLIARQNNFVKVYDEYLKNILYAHMWIIYPYVEQQAIWELIDDINQISMEWMGEYPKIFRDKETLQSYVEALKVKKAHMISECRSAQEVVIYGAGEVGRYFLLNYGKECRHIAGFAVSNKSEESFFEGYEVKEIGKYDRDALIIVAVGQRYASEILQKLNQMRFKNVCYTEYGTLKFLEKF